MTAIARWLAAAVLLCAAPAQAQSTATGVPNALQGFSKNRNQPVKIEATTLELREKDKVATFLGNVNLVQGDTTLKCKALVVYYDGDATGSGMKTANPGPGGQQQIRRLEAKGGVVVTQKDQTATGDNGTFDMRANTVTLVGNVMVTQGPNVLRGDRLVVDLTTGVSRVESGSRGRVEGLFQSGGVKDGRAFSVPGKETPRAPASPPMRLN
jgi:lipopolysaccharide export system protein LptA